MTQDLRRFALLLAVSCAVATTGFAADFGGLDPYPEYDVITGRVVSASEAAAQAMAEERKADAAPQAAQPQVFIPQNGRDADLKGVLRSDAKGNILITDEIDLDRFLERVNGIWDLARGRYISPEVDFSRDAVVGVVLGTQTRTGVDVRIERVERRDGRLTLSVSVRRAAFGLEILNTPYCLVRVPKALVAGDPAVVSEGPGIEITNTLRR